MIKNNLHIYELVEEKEIYKENEAYKLAKEKLEEGYAVEVEKYYREYFYMYFVRWYKKLK